MTRTANPSQLPPERIDEIPVRPSPSKARVVSLAAVLLCGLGFLAGEVGPDALEMFLARNAEVDVLFRESGCRMVLMLSFHLFAVVGAVCAVAGALSLFRFKATYRLLRASLLVAYPTLLVYLWATWTGAFDILTNDIELGGQPQDRATILIAWWGIAWPALAVALYVAWLHVMLASRSVWAAFSRDQGAPMAGDRVLEDLRTHGRDPHQRRSFYASAFTHLAVLVILPALMQMGGCVEPYRVPKGSGNPVVAMVKMVKPKKKKKKTLTLRPNSAIIFKTPDLEDTEVDQTMEKQTQLTYVASANAKAGKMGKGGGNKGGWPEGMDDYKIRFIRLNHGGRGWDDGMNETRADVNFLQAFAKATGFDRVANRGESHSVALLGKYPDDGFPPFVYMTGDHRVGRLSSRDRKTLREYCLKGGMLIADAGSHRFHRSFTRLMRQVFPDKRLLDIADDDMIYQLPYGFPNGAPAFWHHGGRRALGIKHKGRWIVFYHPGDMNDAWKTPGYTDVTPEMRDAAMNLGINLVYYAFNQWDDAVSKAK